MQHKGLGAALSCRDTSHHVAAMTWNHFHFHLQAPKCRLMAKHARRGNGPRPASPNLLCSIYIIYGTARSAKLCASNCSLAGRERKRSMLWNWQPAFYEGILFCHAFLSQYENYDCIFEYSSRCPFALSCFARIVYALPVSLLLGRFWPLNMSGLYWGRIMFRTPGNYDVVWKNA